MGKVYIAEVGKYDYQMWVGCRPWTFTLYNVGADACIGPVVYR